MTIDAPLPPHLQQFIQEQLASGRFHSEGEVVHTALHLLEERADSQEAVSAWLKQEIDKGMSSRPSEPVTKEFWQRIRDRLAAWHSPANEA